MNVNESRYYKYKLQQPPFDSKTMSMIVPGTNKLFHHKNSDFSRQETV